jgi:hypothetical protein
MEKPQHTIRIQPLKTVVALLAISILILIFSLLGQRPYQTGNPTEKFFREMFTNEFFVNNGENIATYWNMFILIVMSALALEVAFVKRAQKARTRFEWAGLTIIFFYFAMDELAGVSHRFSGLLKKLPTMEGGFLYNWLYPLGAVIVILVVLFFIWFAIRLDASNKLLFPVSIILYTLGAFRAELFSGRYAEIYGANGPAYLYLTHVEEFAEYVGSILMIYLLLTYLATLVSEMEFLLQEPAENK